MQLITSWGVILKYLIGLWFNACGGGGLEC